MVRAGARALAAHLADDLHDLGFECLGLGPCFPHVEDPEDPGVVVESCGVDDPASRLGALPRMRSEIAS